MNVKKKNYEQYITEETYKKGTSYFLVFLFMFSVVIIYETSQIYYSPIFRMRISQLTILLISGILFQIAYRCDKKQWIIPVHAAAIILSIANDLIVCTLVQSIEDIPVMFTESHPIGIICYLMVLSLGSLGAKKYCKYAFPILIILYDLNAYRIGIENVQQLILINTLTLFLSYQMHVSEKYIKKYFYAFQNTIDDKDSKLLKTNQELKKVNKKLTEINFALSHDLKTPIHNIKIFSGILKNKKEELTDDLTKEYLGFVYQSSEHISDLVEAMADFANLSYGEKIVDELIDLERVFNNLKNNYQALIHENQLVLRFEENPPNIIGNYGNVYRLIQNIIDNGIIYNESKLKRIEVVHYQKNDKIYFEIKDNGLGIAKDYQEQIFMPFKRLYNKDTYKGSGIGLAFCSEVMQQLGGTIKIVSEVHKGSTFILEFPKVTTLREVVSEPEMKLLIGQ